MELAVSSRACVATRTQPLRQNRSVTLGNVVRSVANAWPVVIACVNVAYIYGAHVCESERINDAAAVKGLVGWLVLRECEARKRGSCRARTTTRVEASRRIGQNEFGFWPERTSACDRTRRHRRGRRRCVFVRARLRQTTNSPKGKFVLKKEGNCYYIRHHV